ncbi:MAG: hypothetical protein WCF84_16160 [Anaerolineae bacterium]
MPEPLMDQARRALREAHTEDAQAILINVIAREPEHEEAWILLAEAITDASKKRECLERARAINPRNRAILRALERLTPLAPSPEPAAPSPRVTPSTPPTDPPAAPPSAVREIIATPIQISAPLLPPEAGAGPIEPLMEQAEAIMEALLLTKDLPGTREKGRDLLRVLDDAAMRDMSTTRQWARTVAREALLQFEKALTAAIAGLPQDDPQLAQLREQRHRALSYLR